MQIAHERDLDLDQQDNVCDAHLGVLVGTEYSSVLLCAARISRISQTERPAMPCLLVLEIRELLMRSLEHLQRNETRAKQESSQYENTQEKPYGSMTTRAEQPSTSPLHTSIVPHRKS